LTIIGNPNLADPKKFVVDKEKGNYSIALQSYVFIPAISLELLFRLAGIHVLLITGYLKKRIMRLLKIQ
jgi:ribosomal protein L5